MQIVIVPVLALAQRRQVMALATSRLLGKMQEGVSVLQFINNTQLF